MIPELSFAAKATQFDHRQGEIEMVVLRFLHNGFIQFKGRHVLRRVGRNEPAVVANRYEYANFHHQPLFVS